MIPLLSPARTAAVAVSAPPPAPVATQEPLPSPPLSPAAERALAVVATQSLLANLVPHSKGTYLSAGQHQFRSFWTRDFCWSIPGLLAIKRADAVRDHLKLLFANVRGSDGLLPRAIDSIDPKLRVTRAIVGYALGIPGSESAPTQTLRPEYTEQNDHPVIDGNVLAILGALSYAQATGDQQFLIDNQDSLKRILDFYDTHSSDDLIVQPGFSDWQDSVSRAGKAFYTNVLWAAALDQLATLGLLGVTRDRADLVHAKVHATFFDPETGLYKSLQDGPQISLDGNLLAIELGFSRQPEQLYAALKSHPLWSSAGGIPGTVTMPDYPASTRNWTSWIAGLGHYHDRVAWSWLIAMSAKVAARMGDQSEAERILGGLEMLVKRDRTVTEIYEPQRMMKPWQRWLYHSERPFSWGAAAAIDAATYVAKRRLDCQTRPADVAGRARLRAGGL